MATQNGLNRYDGHRIRQYFHDNNDSFSIPGNIVYWAYKDSEGGLWFSFGGKGVARYNYAKDRFEKFRPYDSIVKRHNYNRKSWRIGNDQEGRVYFANGSSCFRYSLRTQKMEDLTPLFKSALTGHDIGMFIPQGNNTLWITSNNGMFRYDMKQNSIQHFPFDAEKFGFGDANMHDAEFINDHQLLVAVIRTGFVFFDTRTGTFSLPPQPINPTESKLFSETGGVLKHKNGRIWLANSRYGLLEYLPKTNTIYSLKNEPSYPYPYPEQEGGGLNVYEDDEGNIWYGSSVKGVIWFKPDKDFIQTFQRDFSKTHTLPHNYVTYFLPIEGNLMLIGTAGGISMFNKKTNSFKNFPIAENIRDIYPHAMIRTMAKSRDSVFMATYSGLSIFNTRTEKFSRFTDNGAVADSVLPYGQWLIHYTSPGELMITGSRIVRFNLNTKRYQYNQPLEPDAVYRVNDINASCYDEKTKTLWLEGELGKLFSYAIDSKKLTEHNYTSDSVYMIDAIRVDDEGKVWIGTRKGLFTYNPVSKKSRKINLNTSVPEVYNISIQNKEWIWLSTSKEIVRYNTIKGTTDILSVFSLFPNSEVSKRAFLLDASGFLWVGTNKGFGIIDTHRFEIKTAKQKPQLVDFSVFDKPQSFAQPFSELEKIVLKYDQNFFSFGLSSFNFQLQDPVTYNYFLENFDKSWKEANGNSASYTNVPPGKYYLHVKSFTSSGGWVEKHKPIVVIIRPPFWQSWWFLSLLALLFVIMIYSIYRFAQRRKRKKQIETTIDYFANSLYGENTITEICWDIARNCIAQLKLEDCVVYLLDENKKVLIQKAAHGPKNPKEHEIVNPIEIEIGKGIVGAAAQAAKPVLVKDTSQDNRYIIDDAKRLSELAVPIFHEGNVIGVIDSEHSRKNFFTEAHVKALSTIAAISANKIAEAKAEEAAKESEMQLLEIKKLLAESQLMALRAQMNPHFVFNCLNSIQECIVTEKYGEASLYLNKFSKLFRSVLNNSGKVLITLAEEIEVLELYLALEHMRFEKSFAYNIHVEDDLEMDEIMIPSMLLQPYVENALWHGLMHKENDRELNICFKKLNEDVFQCIVDDNGIGREKALELKKEQNKTKRHVSKGMTISKDRIELLKKQGQHADLKIVDKTNAQGSATGTKVMIELSSFLR
jgi:putative methionine-R-sulfoxide reductase with GAF domain/streptogramin lyase